MEKKYLCIFSFFLVFIFFLTTFVNAAPPVCDWRGYVTIDGSLANTSHIITSYTNDSQATNGTIFSSGYYVMTVPGDNGGNITFKVCGVYVNQAYQTWGCGGVGYNTLNLTMNKSSNGAACTYACGCTGGYCNSGSCASSAPATTTTIISGGSSGGTTGGSAATTTTVNGTTTTTTPPVKETEAVASIPANSTGNFSFETTPITGINVEVKNAVTNAQVTVTKTDAAPATVSIAAPGTVYAYFNIEKINLADANVNKITINFKVEKSWITDNNIDVGTITMNRYVNGVWTPITTKLVSSNGYYYFEAESPGLSVFAVSAQKKLTTTTIPSTTVPVTTTTVPAVIKPGNYTWAVVLIIIIVIVFVIWKYYKKIRKKAKAAISEVVPQQ